MQATKIFISYRRDDAGKEAANIEAALRKQQKQVFRDVSDIQIAERFPARLKKAIEDSDIMIVLIGPAWLNIRDERGIRRIDDPNDFVRREISFALRRMAPERFLDIIPVLVRGANMPKSSDLPGDIRALSEINGYRIGPKTFNEDIAVLLKRIDDLVKEQSECANKVLDELEEALGDRSLAEAADISVKPTAAANRELHDLPLLATWKLTVTGANANFLERTAVICEARFETRESGTFEGQIAAPQQDRIEGHWSLKIGKDRSLMLLLVGNTFGGADLNWGIPIERKAGERSYSGRDDFGNYYRLEWVRRGEMSRDRF